MQDTEIRQDTEIEGRVAKERHQLKRKIARLGEYIDAQERGGATVIRIDNVRSYLDWPRTWSRF